MWLHWDMRALRIQWQCTEVSFANSSKSRQGYFLPWKLMTFLSTMRLGKKRSKVNVWWMYECLLVLSMCVHTCACVCVCACMRVRECVWVIVYVFMHMCEWVNEMSINCDERALRVKILTMLPPWLRGVIWVVSLVGIRNGTAIDHWPSRTRLADIAQGEKASHLLSWMHRSV